MAEPQSITDALKVWPRPVQNEYRRRFINALRTQAERERAVAEYRSRVAQEISWIAESNTGLTALVEQAAGVSGGVIDVLMPSWIEVFRKRMAIEAQSIANLQEMLDKVEELYPDRPNELVEEIRTHIWWLTSYRAVMRLHTRRLMMASASKLKVGDDNPERVEAVCGYVLQLFDDSRDLIGEATADIRRVSEVTHKRLDRLLAATAAWQRPPS